MKQANDQIEQRGLACAGRTDDHCQLLRGHIERAVLDDRAAFAVAEAHVLELDALDEPDCPITTAGFDLGAGSSDVFHQGPVGALAHNDLLVGALRLGQITDRACQQEQHDQHFGQRHLQHDEAEEEAHTDQDRQQRFLQRAHRLLAGHLAPQRASQ